MIFFTENITPFTPSGHPHQIKPIECELTTGEKGYFLGDDLAKFIFGKVSIIRIIDKADIKHHDEFNT